MTERLEGTVVFDGLLEGRLLDTGQSSGLLRDWVERAGRRGLPLSLEMEGDSFSILARNRPAGVEALPDGAAETLAGALKELLEALGPEARGGLFSTLRSMEYRPGQEVQTLYVIVRGEVQTRQRVIEARTTAPEPPLTRGQKLRLAVFGVGAAVLLFLVSSIFVNYRALFDQAVDRIMPFDPNAIAVETDALSDFLTVEKKEIKGGGSLLVLTLARGKAFPASEGALARLYGTPAAPPAAPRGARAASAPASGPASPPGARSAPPPASRPASAPASRPAALPPGPRAIDAVARRLAIDALARGYVRCECFDKEGNFLGFTMQRIVPLRTQKTTRIAVPLVRSPRPVRVVITY